MSISQNFPNIDPTLRLNFQGARRLDPRITFERASIGTYVGADGLIKYAAADEARFDHDPLTGESLGLLIEQEGSNYFPNSQTLSDWVIDNASLTTNTSETLSPDGSNNALKLTATGSGVIQHDVVRFTGINNYQQSTFSVWLKTASGNGHFQMSIGNVTYPGNASTGNLAVYGASVEEYPNGWFRFSIRRNWGAAVGGVTLGIHLNANSGNGGYGVIAPQSFEQSGEALYIWGTQWENKQSSSITTTYIPTSGSTVTRPEDNAYIIGTNFSSWFTPTEGSILMNFKPNMLSSTNGAILSFKNAANSPWPIYRFSGATENWWKWYNGNDGIVTIKNGFSNSLYKFGFAFNQTNGSSAESGVLTQTDITALRVSTDYASSDRMNIGYAGTPGYTSTATINKLVFYPTRLTNTQLQELTQ